MNISPGILIAAQTQGLQSPAAARSAQPAFQAGPPVASREPGQTPSGQAIPETPPSAPLRPGSLLDIKI
jgi:hypothetical protein